MPNHITGLCTLDLKWIDAWAKLPELNKADFLFSQHVSRVVGNPLCLSHNDNLPRGTQAPQLGITASTALSVAAYGDAFKTPQVILRMSHPLGKGPGTSTLNPYRTLNPCLVLS